MAEEFHCEGAVGRDEDDVTDGEWRDIMQAVTRDILGTRLFGLSAELSLTPHIQDLKLKRQPRVPKSRNVLDQQKQNEKVTI